VEAGSEPRGVAYAYALTEEEAAKVAKPRPDLDALVCSFCGKSREEVPHLFTGARSEGPQHRRHHRGLHLRRVRPLLRECTRR
jgi:hypothetical protein